MRKKGKFIVIDGTDGSGKATQTEILRKKLVKARCRVFVEDFPQYGQKSAGLVEEYLNGKFGSAKELGPYIPSMFYAVDRFAAAKRIRKNLESGAIVISNRYTSANMGHQGGKILNRQGRKKYFQWLFDLEYKFFKIPKPDLTVILHMPAAVAQSLVDKKSARSYIKGKKRDLHEADLKHLKQAEKTYIEMSKLFHYPLIECFEKGRILTREEIADKLYAKVLKKLK